MATISVTGAARRLSSPDRGTAQVLVRFQGALREEVSASARAVHERLTADARRFVEDGAAAEWSADQVWISSSERYRGEKKKPKQVTVANASVRVVFVDFTALSRWLTDLSEQEGVQVGGIDWSISDDRRREVEGEVRTEAVLDALSRARAYASALGLVTVEPVRVYEPGLRPDNEPGTGPGYGFMARSAVASSSELTVRPSDLEVHAEVTADFSAH